MHRSRRLAALVPLILAGASLAQSASGKAIQPTTVPTKLALVGGMVIDGYEAPPLHHGAILIEGDRIVRVAPAAQVTIPSDYQVIDTSGRTLMPGMIDLHAHLTILGHGNYGTWFPWVAASFGHTSGNGQTGICKCCPTELPTGGTGLAAGRL